MFPVFPLENSTGYTGNTGKIEPADSERIVESTCRARHIELKANGKERNLVWKSRQSTPGKPSPVFPVFPVEIF
jgi:hypothetical protein